MRKTFDTADNLTICELIEFSVLLFRDLIGVFFSLLVEPFRHSELSLHYKYQCSPLEIIIYLIYFKVKKNNFT